MSVLKGEGKVPILFGSTSIAAGSVTHGGYLARPDLSGEWPTIVVLSSVWGVTSSIKDICRRLARQGFAAIAPDLHVREAPGRDVPFDEAAARTADLPASRSGAIVEDIIEYIQNPAGYWSNAASGYGVLAVGTGLAPAVMAATQVEAAGLALLSPVLTPTQAPLADDEGEDGAEEPIDPAIGLDKIAAQILAISGGADDLAPTDRIQAARSAAPHAEWIIYEGLGGEFADDYAEGFDQPAFADALERIAGFFEKVLPAV